jgi:hypothetical protein
VYHGEVIFRNKRVIQFENLVFTKSATRLLPFNSA